MELDPLSEHPLVSILTSNYNYARFLTDAAESVFAQTYTHFEWIICDDGSSDESVAVMSRLAERDSRIRCIAKGNAGQASGLNAAFAACSGELLVFLDSDDMFHPHKLQAMIQAHRSHPKAGFGLHRVQWVNQARVRQGVWPPAAQMPMGWYGESLLSTGGILPYMPPTSGLTLHRNVANRIFPLPETMELTGVADQMLTRLAPLLTEVLHCRELLAEYRVHGKNAYVRTDTDADTIQREIRTCRNLWSAQKEFLHTLGDGSANRLQPVDRSSYLIYLQYVFARLSHAVDQRVRYKRFMAEMDHGRGIVRPFWRSSLYLPVPIFAFLLSFLNRPSTLKQLVARLRGTAEDRPVLTPFKGDKK